MLCLCKEPVWLCFSNIGVFQKNVLWKETKVCKRRLEIVKKSDESWVKLFVCNNKVAIYQKDPGILATEIYEATKNNNA